MSEAIRTSSLNRPPTVTLQIPGVLRDYCDGARVVALEAATVRAALDHLELRHASLHRNICDETGKVRRHINVFVNSDNVRDLEGLDTTLAPGDIVTIMPAVSGG